MKCLTKEERIRNLRNKGVSEEDATKVVEKFDQMTNTDKRVIANHAHTQFYGMAKMVGMRHNGYNVSIRDFKKVDDKYVISGTVEGGTRKVEFEVSEDLGQVELRNGVVLNYEQIGELLKDIEVVRNMNGYETIVTDLLNDPKEVVKLGEEMAKLDGLSGEHKDILMGNLGRIVGPLAKIGKSINVHLGKRGYVGYDAERGDYVDVFIGVDSGYGNKTRLEQYVHEMYHAVTVFAIRSNDPAYEPIIRQIKRVRDEFVRNVKEEDLVKWSSMGEGKPMTTKEAGEMLDYLSNEESGLEEFVAHAMSNKTVMAGLAKLNSKVQKEEYPNLVARLLGYVRKLVEAVQSRVSKAPRENDLVKMMWLTNRLVQAHERQMQYKKEGAMSRVAGVFNKAEESIKKVMNDVATKQRNKEIVRPKGASKWQNAVFIGKLLGNSVFSEKSKRTMEFMAASTGWSAFRPESSMMTFLRDASESDEVQDMVERLQFQSGHIDQGKEFRDIRTRGLLMEGFSRELGKEERKALTEVLLDADLSVLMDDYDVSKLLDGDLNKEIIGLEATLKGLVDEESYNYYRAQIDLLANYMTDEKDTGNMALLLNARNIALKLNDEDGRLDTVSDEVVSSIDKLVSLKALKKVNPESLETVKGLLEEETQGVVNVLEIHKGLKKMSEQELFPLESDKFRIVKGHYTEVYPREVERVIAPIKDKELMRRKGFRLVRESRKHQLDSTKEAMGLYVSTTQITQNFRRVGLRMTDRHTIGTSVKENHYNYSGKLAKARIQKDIKRMKERTAQIVAEMKRGVYKVGQNDTTLVPLLGNDGKVSDYRYVMSKKDKKEILKMDTDVFTVMGRTHGSMYDKSQSSQFNELMMAEIMKDAEKNYKEGTALGKNLKLYIKIEKDSGNAEVRDFWRILPEDIKRKYPEGFPVRRDLMHMYMGFREGSLMDVPGMKYLPEVIKKAVRVAEMLWKELIKISKADIVIRMPEVLIGNIISNFFIPIMMGYSPAKIIKLKLQGIRELNEYIKNAKEIIGLEMRIEAGRGTKQDERIVSMLKENNAKSPIKDLIDAGFYTSIIEEFEGSTVQGSNLLTEVFEDKFESVPRILKDGLHMLYMTEKSLPFKLMSAATQYSDFTARYAQYHLMLEKGVDKDKAISTVRDYYINYAKPSGRFIEWANSMGLVMFTKYFTRVQRAIKDIGVNNPLKVALLVAGQAAFVDVDDITDQSLFVKDVGNIFYDPMGHLYRVAVPSGYEALEATMSRI